MPEYTVGSHPYHEFLLLRERDSTYAQGVSLVGTFAGRDDVVRFGDDLFEHLDFRLQHVPSLNPCNRKEWAEYGLNQFGPTVINQDGAQSFREAVRSWSLALSSQPPRVRLTDHWFVPIRGWYGRRGNIRSVDVDRDLLVRCLRELERYADRTATGEFFTIHFGI